MYLFFMCSGSRENRHSDWLLHDEALQPDSCGNHSLDTDLQTRVHHRTSAELCGRVGVTKIYMYNNYIPYLHI